MDDLTITTILNRLEGIKHSLSRSRITFLVSSVISLSVILGVWNRYFAWDRQYAFEGRDNGALTADQSPLTERLRGELRSQWVQNNEIVANLVGIHVSASDATILASFSLAVTMLWLFWCTRRDNHTIAFLLKDTEFQNLEIKKLVYHGIVSNLLFTYLSSNDQAITSLKDNFSEGKTARFLRGAVTALSYLPTCTIFICGVVQLIYVFLPSPFDSTKADKHLEWGYIFSAGLISCSSFIATGTIAYRINIFQHGTSKILQEYGAPFMIQKT
jgi:hypothetical protein